MALLHKHVDFVPKEIGVIPWKEAKWDTEKEAWFFRVFFGETGYLEAWLPNWTTKPSFKVVNTSGLSPWEEALGWKRF